MGQLEILAERHELTDELLKAIAKRRHQWREDHGSEGPFAGIEIGAAAAVLVGLMIDVYRRHHGQKPPLHHMVNAVANAPALLMDFVGAAYGVEVRHVDASAALAEQLVGQALGGVRDGGPLQ